MDNLEKLRIMLQHWIEHNKGHVEEFEKWQKLMDSEGKTSLASSISRSIGLMDQVNSELHKALAEMGGTTCATDSKQESTVHHHNHDHHHDHEHEHGHDHQHHDHDHHHHHHKH
jgi:hypothetical protein